MAEAYKLNNKGMIEVFGTIVTRESSDSFLAYAARKDSLTIDREDEDGIQIDLAAPKLKSREFILNCTIVANNRADYMNYYNGLFTELIGADTHTIYIKDHDKTYSVYYKEQRGLKKYGNLDTTAADKIGVSFQLVLGERNPAENIDFVYLVDNQDRYLIA